jgi:hypothetical protein
MASSGRGPYLHHSLGRLLVADNSGSTEGSGHAGWIMSHASRAILNVPD